MTRRVSDEPRLFWEDFRRLYPVKALALAVIIALTVVSCGKEASLSMAIDDLNYDSLPAKAPRPTKPAEKLHAAVVELKELLAVQSGKDLTEKQAEQARKARAAVAANLAAVEKQFESDRKKLGDLEAKEALKRLAVIEGKTDEIKSDLIDALAVVPKSGEKTSSARVAIKQLTALSPDKPQQPLSSDLSFGIKNAKPRSVSLSAGITPAYQAPSPDAEPSSLPREPEPADLEETDETKITPAIEQLATELDHDPVKIYEYVRNNVKFEPYYGIRKGADQTLAEKAGSDADQAALLIALMRESGVPARFVQGVAELPAAKAANWLGVDVANGERMDAVPEILWSGGIPTTPVRANGDLVKVRFEHFWAEVYVKSAAYRGVNESDTGSGRWHSLSASIKPIAFERPTFDLRSALRPVVDEWSNQTLAESSVLPNGGVLAPTETQSAESITQYSESVLDVLSEHGVSGQDDMARVVGRRSIQSSTPGLIPSSTPFRPVLVQNESRDVASQYEASVTIEVMGSRAGAMPTGAQPDEFGFGFTAPTHRLADRRVSISYIPGGSEDAEVVDAYHGALNAPGYSASLVPALRVGGDVVARGTTPTPIGYQQRLAVRYRTPGMAGDVTASPVDVGALISFSISVGGSAKRLRARADSLANSSLSPPNPALTDSLAGEMFSQFGSLYFLRNDRFNNLMARMSGVHAMRQVSGATVGTHLSTAYVGGFPVALGLRGIAVDVDRDANSVVSLTNEIDSDSRFSRAAGLNASLSEADMLSAVLGGSAASTATVLSTATKNRIPVFQIDQSNLDGALNSIAVGDQVENEIRRAVVESDAVVTIPSEPVSVGGWTGVGYVIETASSSDFRIEGGTSGGVLTNGESGTPVAFDQSSIKSAGVSISAESESGFPEEDPCDMRYLYRAIAAFTAIFIVISLVIGGPLWWLSAALLFGEFVLEMRHIQEVDEECAHQNAE